MQTTDEGKLFRTDEQLNAAEVRYQKSQLDKKPSIQNGYPIILPSKPLRFVIDKDDIYISQNGFVSQRINLKTGKIKSTFKGHTGPVTSISIYNHIIDINQYRKILVTGSWDKTIKIWDVKTQILLSSSTAHVDFVKSIEIISKLGIIASGSTDRHIRLWDLKKSIDTYDWRLVDSEYCRRKQINKSSRVDPSSLESPTIGDDTIILGENEASASERSKWPAPLFMPMVSIGVLKSHTRPIDALASHPMIIPSRDQEESSDSKNVDQAYLLVSADTMGAVKVWCLFSRSGQITSSLDFTSYPHQTSINSIQLGSQIRDEIEGESQSSAELWTASADKSVMLSSLDLSCRSGDRLKSVMRFEHPYYVRCVLNVPLCLARLGYDVSTPNWLVTGSTDEGIRLFDLDEIQDGFEKKIKIIRESEGKNLKSIEEGWIGCLKSHWDEVNGLDLWYDQIDQTTKLISSSLDGTIRRWDLNQLKKIILNDERDEVKQIDVINQEPKMELTLEEEAELAELMND